MIHAYLNFSKIIIIILILLLSSPIFSQTNQSLLRSFIAESKNKYFTKGHPKANGLNISIEYPKRWIAKEGERPHIVQKFVGEIKNGMSVMCLLTVREIPDYDFVSIDEETFKELVTIDVMKNFIPPNADLITIENTKIDGEPAALLVYSFSGERAGFSVITLEYQYMFLYKSNMILAQFSIGGHKSNFEQLKNVFNSYIPLFKLLGSSIIIHDKWEDAANINNSSPSSNNSFWGSLILSFIISAIITWGIGLIPPFLIRYVFLKRPLSKVPSIIIVTIFLFLNLIIFVSLGSQSKTHYALVLIAFASYYILRAGRNKIDEKVPEEKSKNLNKQDEQNKFVVTSEESYKNSMKKSIEHFKKGDLKSSLKYLNIAIDSNPKSHLAYYNRSIVYNKIGNQEASIKDLKISSDLGNEKAKAILIKKGLIN